MRFKVWGTPDAEQTVTLRLFQGTDGTATLCAVYSDGSIRNNLLELRYGCVYRYTDVEDDLGLQLEPISGKIVVR